MRRAQLAKRLKSERSQVSSRDIYDDSRAFESNGGYLKKHEMMRKVNRVIAEGEGA